MTGLRKILLFTLVICTLGYGSAWAFDGHATEADEFEITVNSSANTILMAGIVTGSQLDQADNQITDNDSAADATCDHSCHISAHLQAIFPQNGYLCSVNQSSELLEFSETPLSYIVSPDLRPPRV